MLIFSLLCMSNIKPSRNDHRFAEILCMIFMMLGHHRVFILSFQISISQDSILLGKHKTNGCGLTSGTSRSLLSFMGQVFTSLDNHEVGSFSCKKIQGWHWKRILSVYYNVKVIDGTW